MFLSNIDQLTSCFVSECQLSNRKANVLKRGYSSSKHFQHSCWSGNWGAGAENTTHLIAAHVERPAADLHPRSWTVSENPLKNNGKGRRSFGFEMAYFQGRTVNFPGWDCSKSPGFDPNLGNCSIAKPHVKVLTTCVLVHWWNSLRLWMNTQHCEVILVFV